MDDLKNLEELLEILKAQEQMQDLLERQQAEIDSLQEQLEESLKEQLEESLKLNEQLTTQNKRLQEQIDELSNLKT